MTFELFGPASKHHAHHHGCRHARAAVAEAAGKHGANLMAKHMASARFGSDGMLAAMLAIAQVPVFCHPVDLRAQTKVLASSPHASNHALLLTAAILEGAWNMDSTVFSAMLLQIACCKRFGLVSLRAREAASTWITVAATL